MLNPTISYLMSISSIFIMSTLHIWSILVKPRISFKSVIVNWKFTSSINITPIRTQLYNKYKQQKLTPAITTHNVSKKPLCSPKLSIQNYRKQSTRVQASSHVESEVDNNSDVGEEICNRCRWAGRPCYCQGNLAFSEPAEGMQVIAFRSHCVPFGQQCCLSVQHVACRPHTKTVTVTDICSKHLLQGMSAKDFQHTSQQCCYRYRLTAPITDEIIPRQPNLSSTTAKKSSCY